MNHSIELLRIWISRDLALRFDIAHWLIIGGLALLAIVLILRKLSIKGLISHEIELNVTLGGLGNLSIKPNHQVRQIAHQAWTELATRKAGIPIDIDHDVIVEVYDSWYNLFAHIRELIMLIPAQQLKNPETKKLVDLLVESLNKGLRPHLTKWQAKFRRWYEKNSQKPANDERTPQEIQRDYPEFTLLVEDLLRINAQIVDYGNELKKLIK